jgi:hypothetical protein
MESIHINSSQKLNDFLLEHVPGCVRVGREWKSLCPYTLPGQWTGEDRFVIRLEKDRIVTFTRGVMNEKHKPTSHDFQELVDVLAAEKSLVISYSLPEILSTFETEGIGGTRGNAYHGARKTLKTYTFHDILPLHLKVQREYWYSLGINDKTIDAFRLGYGLHPGNRASKLERHLIPIQVTDVSWVFKSRKADPEDIPHLAPPQMPNMLESSFFVDRSKPKNIAYIVEGERALLSMWQIKEELGDDYSGMVFTTSSGSSVWEEAWSKFILGLGFKTILIVKDNDVPGATYANAILSSFYTFDDSLEIDVIEWEEDRFPLKYDIGDLLSDYKQEAAELFLSLDRLSGKSGEDSNIYQPRFFPNFLEDDPTVFPPSIEVARDEMRGRTHFFVNKYKERYYYPASEEEDGRGSLLLLQSDPGIGKSYMVTELLENFALEKLQDPAYQGEGRRNYNIAALAGERKNGWGDLMKHAKHPELWFNQQARNEDNCENYGVASALGSKGYNVRRFCETTCPLFSKCKESGYISQDERRKKFPLVYLRHQHLRVQEILSPMKLLVVDESPLGMFSPITVSSYDLEKPQDWIFSSVDLRQNQIIYLVLQALRRLISDTMISGENTAVISGTSLLYRLDTLLGGKLVSLMRDVELSFIEDLTSHTMRNIENEEQAKELPKAYFDLMFNILAQETLEYYAQGIYRVQSKIHLYNQRYSLFDDTPIFFKENRPMIVADATADPELLSRATHRDVVIHNAAIRSPNAHTYAILGSENTKTSLILAETHPDIVRFLKHVCQKHRSVLVVTYKALEDTIKAQLLALPEYDPLNWNVHFEHFNNLRGTNLYKEFESVVILGVPRMPPEDFNILTKSWFAGDAENLNYTRIRIPCVYHGTKDAYEINTFADKRLQDFVDHTEAAEMLQCAARIRPHTDPGSDKFVYAMTARPFAHWHTRILTMREMLFEWEQKDQYLQQAEQLFEKDSKISQEALRVALKISANRARDIHKIIREKRKVV